MFDTEIVLHLLMETLRKSQDCEDFEVLLEASRKLPDDRGGDIVVRYPRRRDTA